MVDHLRGGLAYTASVLWRGGAWTLGSLVALYLVLAIGSARQKSVTVDELGHLPSGVYTLTTGDLRFASLNPPLLNVLSALPVLALDLAKPLEAPEPSDDPFSFWSAGYHFHEMHREDYRRIFDAARWVPISIVAALGLLLFEWGRRLAPEAPETAGLLAAGFVLFSPNVLAQARIVGTETGTAFFVLLAHFALFAMLRRPGALTTIGCGVAVGLAQLTKFYALLLYPVFLVIVVVWSWRRVAPAGSRPVARLLGAFALSFVVVNAGYLGQEWGVSLGELRVQSESLQRLQGSVLGDVPIPLSGAYVRAFDGQLVEIGSGLRSFLFGETFEGGRPDFYLALLLVKTPVALWVAFAVGLAVNLPRPRLAPHELVLLLAYPVSLFVALSASDGRQLGVRALLSATPLVWLWVCASIARAWPRRWPGIAGAGALAALVATSVQVHPHYLPFFNFFAGGSENGYRLASTANVDIGQDLVLLSEFLEQEGSPRIQLLYFGSVDPALYGIDYEVPTTALKPGWLAVSVSLYRSGYPTYDHGALSIVGPVDEASLGEPIARLGGSIHVYRIR